jgi:hypothetical protein
MRLHFTIHLLGQLSTFAWLTESMGASPELRVDAWPEFSIYNALVANLWPVYWAARLVDPLKLDQTYWDVFEGAAVRAGEIQQAFVLFWG